MRNLIILFVLVLVSMLANAQDVQTKQFVGTQAGVTEYYQDSISLQQGCLDCPKSYKLYDGVRFTFFQGRIIGMSEFRAVASLIGEVVGIRYDRSSKDNQRILHAKISRQDYNRILHVCDEIFESKLKTITPEQRDSIMSVPMIGDVKYDTNLRQAEDRMEEINEAFNTANEELEQLTSANNINVIVKDTVKVVRPYFISNLVTITPDKFSVSHNVSEEVALLPPFATFQMLDDIWDEWQSCNEAVDYRKARFAILMARKYGGYDTPTEYGSGLFNIELQQERFCNKEGHRIPFLGWDEGAYKQYYEWKEPTVTRRKSKPTGIPLGKISGSRRLKGAALVVASRRACKKRG